MPMHDWTQVEPNIFHHFHQHWTTTICDALNTGLMPKGLSALIEQHTGEVAPHVVTWSGRSRVRNRDRVAGEQSEPIRRAIVGREDLRSHGVNVLLVDPFFRPIRSSPVPLEKTYQSAWDVCPSDYRYFVEHGHLPDV